MEDKTTEAYEPKATLKAQVEALGEAGDSPRRCFLVWKKRRLVGAVVGTGVRTGGFFGDKGCLGVVDGEQVVAHFSEGTWDRVMPNAGTIKTGDLPE